GPPGTRRAAERGQAALERAHAVLVDLRSASWRLPLAAWEAEVAAGYGWACAAGGLQDLGRLPGAAALHASVDATLRGSPRRHKQSTRSGRCAPARAGCAGGRSRERDIRRVARDRFRQRWDGTRQG